MDQLAYEDAVDLYERALEVLDLLEEPDEAQRCELLLALGGAEASAAPLRRGARGVRRGPPSSPASSATPTAWSARRSGSRCSSEAGNVDERLVALIDEALEAIGARAQRRAAPRCSARSRRSSTGSTPQGEVEPLVDEAIEIAREVDAPDDARHRRCTARSSSPVGARRPARAAGDRRRDARARRERPATARLVVRAHAYRLMAYLELGDIDGVDRELAAYARLAEELRSRSTCGTRTPCGRCGRLLDGDSTRPSGSPSEARRAGERAEQPLASQFYGDPADPDPQPPGPRRRAAARRSRELAERFPGDPRLAHAR